MYLYAQKNVLQKKNIFYLRFYFNFITHNV